MDSKLLLKYKSYENCFVERQYVQFTFLYIVLSMVACKKIKVSLKQLKPAEQRSSPTAIESPDTWAP